VHTARIRRFPVVTELCVQYVVEPRIGGVPLKRWLLDEIGWAAAHPVLEHHGFRYVNANIWDKGIAHIAGNVSPSKPRTP
jgi:hypothetical protein